MKEFFKKIMAFFKAADKQLHILAEYAIALTVFVFFAAFHIYWLAWVGFAVALVVAVVAGAWKEWRDYKNPDKGTFEIADIVADALGILAASSVMLFYMFNAFKI